MKYDDYWSTAGEIANEGGGNSTTNSVKAKKKSFFGEVHFRNTNTTIDPVQQQIVDAITKEEDAAKHLAAEKYANSSSFELAEKSLETLRSTFTRHCA